MTTQVVVDSSVVLKWIVLESDSRQATRLLLPGIERMAPEFALAEVANALWKHERIGNVRQVFVERAVATLPSLFAALLPTARLLGDASKLARAIDHPIYDCLYVIAARLTGNVLVTADRNLLNKVSRTADAANVVSLAKWKAP